MKLKFWGTRGSIAVPGAKTIKYGGNTPCVQISCADEQYVIIDAGTGIKELGKEIVKNKKIKKISILISHTHWDHIQGLPFFAPLYDKDFNVTIFSNVHEGMTFDHIIEAQWHPVFFPVNKDVLKAKIKFKNIVAKKKYTFGSLKIETMNSNHSEGTLSFKVTHKDKSIVYLTDNELKYLPSDGKPNIEKISEYNKGLVNFCNNCDYLIHDSMYSLKDYKNKIGWGHSNNIAAAYFAISAKVKNLVLFHYEPDYNDKKVDKMFSGTKEILKKEGSKIKCIASKELMEINL